MTHFFYKSFWMRNLILNLLCKFKMKCKKLNLYLIYANISHYFYDIASRKLVNLSGMSQVLKIINVQNLMSFTLYWPLLDSFQTLLKFRAIHLPTIIGHWTMCLHALYLEIRTNFLKRKPSRVWNRHVWFHQFEFWFIFKWTSQS